MIQDKIECIGCQYYNPKECFCDAIGECVKYSAPVDDLIKHGHWIFTEYESGDAEYCCSECKEGVYDRPNYCPNCGADMRGEQE